MIYSTDIFSIARGVIGRTCSGGRGAAEPPPSEGTTVRTPRHPTLNCLGCLRSRGLLQTDPTTQVLQLDSFSHPPPRISPAT